MNGPSFEASIFAGVIAFGCFMSAFCDILRGHTDVYGNQTKHFVYSN